MRNFLIFLGIIIVGYLAVTDTVARFEELENIAVSTPSQIEMKSNMLKSRGGGIEQKLGEDTGNSQNSNMIKKRTDNIKDQTQTVKKGVQDKYHNLQPKSAANSSENNH